MLIIAYDILMHRIVCYNVSFIVPSYLFWCVPLHVLTSWYLSTMLNMAQSVLWSMSMVLTLEGSYSSRPCAGSRPWRPPVPLAHRISNHWCVLVSDPRRPQSGKKLFIDKQILANHTTHEQSIAQHIRQIIAKRSKSLQSIAKQSPAEHSRARQHIATHNKA